jgi:hypothetical protein
MNRLFPEDCPKNGSSINNLAPVFASRLALEAVQIIVRSLHIEVPPVGTNIEIDDQFLSEAGLPG